MIAVGSGFYGRVNSLICGTTDCMNVTGSSRFTCGRLVANNLACSFSNATAALGSACNGLMQCSVSVDTVFGTDPCPGTYKYAFSTYRCVAPTVVGTQVSSCSGSSLSLDCGVNSVIRINSAFYGRKTSAICGVNDCISTGFSSSQCTSMISNNINCSFDGATTSVQSSCNGRFQCRVAVNSIASSEPCPGTFKYASVDYSCLALNVTGKIFRACYGYNLNLTCPSGKTIRVNSAFYGRQTTNICGVNDCVNTGFSSSYCEAAVSNNIDCSYSQALSVVSSSCNNLRTCVRAVSSLFTDDPCPAVFKYASVDYSCI